MSNRPHHISLFKMISCMLLLMWAMVSCDKQRAIPFNAEKFPDEMLFNADVMRSERGTLQIHLTAPEIAQYTKPESKTCYPKGVNIVFLNDDLSPKSSLCAKYAISFNSRDVMYAKDSVVIIDYVSNDTILLEDIVWSKREGRVFSRHLVESHNGNRVTFGDGFESDDAFNNLRIIKQRGTIEVIDEEPSLITSH